VSGDRSAKALAEYVFKCLDEYCTEENKLTTEPQLWRENLNGLPSRVRQTYSDALFFRCFAHRLNTVPFQAICNSKECTIFFKTVDGYSAFSLKISKEISHVGRRNEKTVAKSCAYKMEF
jgi:hypothetical protein